MPGGFGLESSVPPVIIAYENSQVVLICHLVMLITSQAFRLFPFSQLSACSLKFQHGAWKPLMES